MRRRYIETYTNSGDQGTDFLEVWIDGNALGFRTSEGHTCFLSNRAQQQNLVDVLQRLLAGHTNPLAPTQPTLWRDIE